MDEPKSTSSAKWVCLLALLVLLGGCCVSSWLNSTKNLGQLTKTTGILNSAEVLKISTNPTHYAVVLTLAGTTEQFGVRTGPTRQAALDFKAGLEIGEEMTVYHEAPGLLPYASINYDISQLEQRAVLLPLVNVRQSSQGNFALSLVAFFIVAILVLNEYLKKRSAAQADY